MLALFHITGEQWDLYQSGGKSNPSSIEYEADQVLAVEIFQCQGGY